MQGHVADVDPPADGDYEFQVSNPYLTHDNPFAEGEQLFRDGILGEAALAFEAALQREPHRTDAWRLLGIVHAENEDD